MRLLFIIILFFFISSVFAEGIAKTANKAKSSPDSVSFIQHNEYTIDLQTLDSSYYSAYINNAEEVSWKDVYNFPEDSVPDYQDKIYSERIEYLNTKSPFSFQYNESVRRMIGFYSHRRKGMIQSALVRKDLYFPLFEKMLDKYHIPMELKYLAIVESALNPSAKSRVGAQGLWQFMPGTGRLYGLHRNSRVDDRMNIYKSTEAACQHFCDLYDRYNDWNLVLAAYNAGPGNVNKAIRRGGGKITDYWYIRQYLPRETQNYVPAFIAINYMMQYNDAHNIQAKTTKKTNFFELDTIYISQKLTFKNLSKWLDIDIKLIEDLNPQYRRNYIPARMEGTTKSYVLTLPNAKIGEFILNEDKILSGLTPKEWELQATK